MRLCKTFANNSPADTELSKTYISKMKQLGGFFGDLAVDLLQVAFRTGIEAGKRGASILAKNARNCFADKK